MKPVYILGSGNISPQQTWDAEALEKVVSYQGNRLTCIEPDYASWIDVKQLRRMSRIMKMGAGAAMLALKQAGVAKPDAIISGTGSGCLEDTGTFLTRMINQQEDALNPTPFIQSTHNTIGSHLALLLQCQGYNQTYAHSAFSFESALLDAMMVLQESPDKTVLAGGTDEITDASHLILSRFGIFKSESANSLELFKSLSKGTLDGEGSAWFVLTGSPGSNIKIEGIKTLYKPEGAMVSHINDFLSACKIENEEIDLVLFGKSGDSELDAGIRVLYPQFKSSSIGVFKHLCGEFPVAASFAMWLAQSILRTNKIPAEIIEHDHHREAKSILIYNPYFRDHHSLILMRKDE